MPALFSLGQIVATPGALETLAESHQNAAEFIKRHVGGDYGEVCDDDKRLNDQAIQDESRILSAFVLANGERLWIITEADRSSTCLLLPSEY